MGTGNGGGRVVAGEEWEGLPTSEHEDVCQPWGSGSDFCDMVGNVQARVHIWLIIDLCNPGKHT